MVSPGRELWTKTLAVCLQYLVVAFSLDEHSFRPRIQREFIEIMPKNMVKYREQSCGLIGFASVLNRIKWLGSYIKPAYVAYF